MKAIYAGSFDPITNGHLDIITRASKLFDEVVVAVGCNSNKKCYFSLYERTELVQKAIKEAHLTNVSVIGTGGLIVNLCNDLGAKCMIRGLRTVSDFEYEIQLATINKSLNENIETMFIPCDPTLSCISSSSIRELASHGADIDKFVPQCVTTAFNRKRLERSEGV